MNEVISLKFKADIIYVAGEINDKTVIFDRESDEIWSAVVSRSEDGVYRVKVTAWDELNRPATYEGVERFGLYAIIDREQNDPRPSRRYYNSEDLNRVETSTEYVSELLIQVAEEMLEYVKSLNVFPSSYHVPFGPHDPVVRVKKNWNGDYEVLGLPPDEPPIAEMDRYINNVKLLKDLSQVETVELPESIRRLDWRGANNIERVLLDIYYFIPELLAELKDRADKTAAGFNRYLGEYYLGEDDVV